jgi:hypothetical protein
MYGKARKTDATFDNERDAKARVFELKQEGKGNPRAVRWHDFTYPSGLKAYKWTVSYNG